MGRIEAAESRAFATAYLQTMDPALAAQTVGESDGIALLGKKEVIQQLARRREILRRQLLPEDVIRKLSALAFGRCNDCVKLVIEDAPDVQKLDLSMLSEIKRNEKGTVEIKLIDRLAALEQLAGLVGSEDGAMEELRSVLGMDHETP